MLAYLFYLEYSQVGAMGLERPSVLVLFIMSGAVTALPLLLFAASARLVPLSMLGVLQYVAPTLQFLLGIALYHESFSATQLLGFVLIWAALALYTLEGMQYLRRRAQLRLGPAIGGGVAEVVPGHPQRR